MVFQGVLYGEIPAATAANGHLQTIVSDWYSEVKGIQRGVWHYSGQDIERGLSKSLAQGIGKYLIRK